MFGFTSSKIIIGALGLLLMVFLAAFIPLINVSRPPREPEEQTGRIPATQGLAPQADRKENRLKELRERLAEKRTGDMIVNLRKQGTAEDGVIDAKELMGDIPPSFGISEIPKVPLAETFVVLRSATSAPITSAPATTATSVPLVTDEEVFRTLNPPEYLDTLSFIQDGLISIGEFREEERLEINSYENIAQILLRGTNFLEKNSLLPKEDLKRFKKYLNEQYLKDMRTETEIMRRYLETVRLKGLQSYAPHKKGGGQKFYSPISVATIPPPQISLIQKFGLVSLFKLVSALFSPIPRPAQAAWVNLGAICYKDDNPFYPVPGPNLVAPCCNCGLVCRKGSCTPVPDCGQYSTRCDVPLGCLNLSCRAWPNAIWDPLTLICGCG